MTKIQDIRLKQALEKAKKVKGIEMSDGTLIAYGNMSKGLETTEYMKQTPINVLQNDLKYEYTQEKTTTKIRANSQDQSR